MKHIQKLFDIFIKYFYLIYCIFAITIYLTNWWMYFYMTKHNMVSDAGYLMLAPVWFTGIITLPWSALFFIILATISYTFTPLFQILDNVYFYSFYIFILPIIFIALNTYLLKKVLCHEFTRKRPSTNNPPHTPPTLIQDIPYIHNTHKTNSD